MVRIERRAADELVVMRDGVIVARVVRFGEDGHQVWSYGWLNADVIRALAAAFAELEPLPAKAECEAAARGPIQELVAALERSRTDFEEVLKRIGAAQAELERGTK